MLESLGCRVDGVSTGQAAVEAASRVPYDLILMDCQMPGMDGYVATRLIRRDERQGTRRIPIVALTAHASKGDRAMCLAVGMDDYLSKPYTHQELQAIVQRWLAMSLSTAPSLSEELRQGTSVSVRSSALRKGRSSSSVALSMPFGRSIAMAGRIFSPD